MSAEAKGEVNLWGRERDGFGEILVGADGLSEGAVGGGAIAIGVGVSGIEPDGFGEVSDRFVVLSESNFGITAPVEGEGEVGAQGDGVVKLDYRFGEPVGPGEDPGAFVSAVGGGGCRGRGLGCRGRAGRRWGGFGDVRWWWERCRGGFGVEGGGGSGGGSGGWLRGYRGRGVAGGEALDGAVENRGDLCAVRVEAQRLFKVFLGLVEGAGEVVGAAAGQPAFGEARGEFNGFGPIGEALFMAAEQVVGATAGDVGAGIIGLQANGRGAVGEGGLDFSQLDEGAGAGHVEIGVVGGEFDGGGEIVNGLLPLAEALAGLAA